MKQLPEFNFGLRFFNRIDCVVPISGGKDSQACLKLALKEFDKNNICGLFCDTKFEHPKTYKHVYEISRMYGIEIRIVNAGSVEEKCTKYKRFPGGGARHCTDELKIIPSKKFYKALAEEQGGFIVYYGMRSEESAERAKRYSLKLSEEVYQPHEVLAKYPKYLGKLGVRFKMPLLEHSTKEVFEILDGEHNPLYDEGFDRVGCFPCLAGGDRWKEKAFAHDKFGQEQRIKVELVEKAIGKSVFTSNGALQRNNKDQMKLFDDSRSGCGVCDI
jgi:3'-phosphoadenosine 5'-phosphosulfate sulfotransferase (PAPS reductase)/FAD synthetase